jgi:hypothetical protein
MYKNDSGTNSVYFNISLNVIKSECSLPIPTFCDRCRTDIVEILSYHFYSTDHKHLIKEEYYCKRCTSGHFGFNKEFSIMNIIEHALEPIYEKRIQPKKE